MRQIKNIKDVVDWGLCTGCGACSYACPHQAITLENVESVGIRPKVDLERCASNCVCLAICPGYSVDGYLATGKPAENTAADFKFGPALEIWEGHAADPEIRLAASSGGALTALALYCLEKEKMEFVLHAAMDAAKPYTNITVRSRNRAELLSRAGSRYAPASPGEGLGWIEESQGACVFIGKPCDAAAAVKLCKQRPLLDKKMGLILTFFCAGTPSTAGTLNLIQAAGALPAEVDNVRYRGHGWPGEFRVSYKNRTQETRLDYENAWGSLQKYRPFRCHLCPDGTGQVADIACGDAWHEYTGNGNSGLSLIIIRTERGRAIFHRAVKAGYLAVKPATTSKVLVAQKNLLERRTQIFGRLLAMRLLFIPTPKFVGFWLAQAWLKIPLAAKARTIFGTLRRLVQRRLWHRHPVHPKM
jgi:coenzyme F420 hydrogenase subunit beta